MDERRGRVTNAMACISSGSSDSIVRALPLLVGRLASRPSIRNEFYRYRQISPFKPSEFSRNIYPRFIPRIYIPLFSTKRPTFFRNQSRPVWIIDDRWEYLSFLFFEIWKIVRSKEGREGKERIVFSRSLVRDIFTPQSRARDIARDSPLNEPKPRR